MTDNIAIMGAGALGSYVGSFLARDGQKVTFIDIWPEHVEKMRKDGLHVTGSQGPWTTPVNALHLTDAQAITEQFDFVFIAMKSYDTVWATHFIKRFVKSEGFFVSLQNPVIISIEIAQSGIRVLILSIKLRYCFLSYPLFISFKILLLPDCTGR